MMNDRSEQAAVQAATLDDILSRWHHHCKTFSAVQVRGADPTFRMALRAKGEQTLDAIGEDQAHAFLMETMDFQVYQLQDPYRTAILFNARNLYTGRNVWLSPRLPREQIERAQVVGAARQQLIRRLINAGVM